MDPIKEGSIILHVATRFLAVAWGPSGRGRLRRAVLNKIAIRASRGRMCVTILCFWSPPVRRQFSAPHLRAFGFQCDKTVMQTAAFSNKIAVGITVLSLRSQEVLRCGVGNVLRTGGLQRHKIVTRMRPRNVPLLESGDRSCGLDLEFVRESFGSNMMGSGCKCGRAKQDRADVDLVWNGRFRITILSHWSPAVRGRIPRPSRKEAGHQSVNIVMRRRCGSGLVQQDRHLRITRPYARHDFVHLESAGSQTVSVPHLRTSGLHSDRIVLQTAALSNKTTVCIAVLSFSSSVVLRCGPESCPGTGGLQRHKTVTHMRPCQSYNAVMHGHRSCSARPRSHRDLITLEPGESRTNFKKPAFVLHPVVTKHDRVGAPHKIKI
jgi:hypothetical protein